MLTFEGASGGRIVASCNGQLKNRRFQKSKAKIDGRLTLREHLHIC